jgi:hypothetical protein
MLSERQVELQGSFPRKANAKWAVGNGRLSSRSVKFRASAFGPLSAICRPGGVTKDDMNRGKIRDPNHFFGAPRLIICEGVVRREFAQSRRLAGSARRLQGARVSG